MQNQLPQPLNAGRDDLLVQAVRLSGDRVIGASEEKIGSVGVQDAFEIAGRLHSAAIHLLRRLRVRDLASGIGPAQLSALSVLVFGGPRSLGKLAEAEQVRPPTMSRIIAGLESEGLVRRHETQDRRRVRLEATAKGTKILHEGRKRRVESLASALSSLTPAELSQLGTLAELLQRVLTKV